MRAYLDSSVILRVILGEPERLSSWGAVTEPVSSRVVKVECLRTIDRARIRLALEDEQVARHRRDVLEMVDGIALVELDRRVLDRAADPFPTLLGSLDAIHLASAIMAREETGPLVFATHDRQLALAALASGFEVHGVAIP